MSVFLIPDDRCIVESPGWAKQPPAIRIGFRIQSRRTRACWSRQTGVEAPGAVLSSSNTISCIRLLNCEFFHLQTRRTQVNFHFQCNHVIYCYRKGFFDRNEHLNESMQEIAFQKYLADLREMHNHRASALRRICALMYDIAWYVHERCD